MKVVLKENLLILAPQTPEEEAELAVWKAGTQDHVFAAALRGTGLALHDLGPKEHARNEPLNVSSRAPEACRVLRPTRQTAHGLSLSTLVALTEPPLTG